MREDEKPTQRLHCPDRRIPTTRGIGDGIGLDDDGMPTADRTPILFEPDPPFGTPVDADVLRRSSKF
jgi:hypothetical protein